jgi:hypothetical protein
VTTVVGQWRATYTPGDWVLLAGPTSTVLLEPPPPQRASMIEVLWEEVLASSSMTELAGRLASYPLDALPSFAAFFWTADGMRSLVRGAVSVVDLSSGVTVADGEGIQTWSEVGLGQVSQVLVDVQAGDGSRPELPLVVGAVRASSVRLDASEAARVRSPQVPVPPADEAPADSEDDSADTEEEPAYAADGAGYAEAPPPYAEQAPAYAEDGAAYAAEPEADDDGEDPDQSADRGSDVDAAWAGATAAVPPAPGPVAELPGASTELLADPFADDDGPPPQEWRPEEWSADAWSPEAAPESGSPAPESADDDDDADDDQGDTLDPADPDIEYPMWEPDPDPVPARALPEDGPAEMENADTQLMPPPYAGSPTETGVSQDSLIMAVVCPYGHASAQNATACRICGNPIAPQGPQLLPRPVLAVLRASDGTTAEVDRAVLVGRAPSAQRSNARTPRLMVVPSPGHDISRTHLEVAVEGWTVTVTDLHSTNGTILVRPGGVDRQPLPAGEAVPVELGSVVELGDGISVLIDFPQ